MRIFHVLEKETATVWFDFNQVCRAVGVCSHRKDKFNLTRPRKLSVNVRGVRRTFIEESGLEALVAFVPIENRNKFSVIRNNLKRRTAKEVEFCKAYPDEKLPNEEPLNSDREVPVYAFHHEGVAWFHLDDLCRVLNLKPNDLNNVKFNDMCTAGEYDETFVTLKDVYTLMNISDGINEELLQLINGVAKNGLSGYIDKG